ncbi:3D domain-containing protein [Lysinibacillus sp. NPDC093712]|uniref:3D domain-containing protein n=1 Tax=Lysinibacillus sp. NPDC093712 TaxID=3390579 RepID=UPI003D064D2A
MTMLKRILLALLLALTLFINAHKPSDHEHLAESPTERYYEIIPYVNGYDAIYTQYLENERQQAEIAQKIKRKQALEEAQRLYDAKLAKIAQHKQISRGNNAKLTQFTMIATFYTAQCNGCTGITANGTEITRTITYKGYRVIAADRSIPFGTILRITLNGGTVINGIVADRGGAIKGARLDILVASNSEAYHLGRQLVTVERIGYYGE